MSYTENNRYIVQVYVGALSQHYEALSVEASKQTTSEEIVTCIVERLSLEDASSCYELAEVVGDRAGQECKERRLGDKESPVALMLLWPKIHHTQQEYYRFYLREKLSDTCWTDSFSMDPALIRDYLYRFLYQPKDREYPDLCQLPDLNEQTLLDNLRARFNAGHIYTYVGSILIALNPFKFHPIYNPKYVKLYQNRRLGAELPPHIFAVADSAYHCMLKEKRNQCVVISGESGSGKTESTNFLLHHLTALSQKGSHGSGVEQTILSAGPVLEAFGNAKTAHNNNSSRFGKFIQVNYKENGMVHGAVVQKYLLEKSRICSQGRNERNYHVFYYLLAGASDVEKKLLHLLSVQDYNYLNRSGCYTLDNVDEKYEFSRLKQSMEMVGFNSEKQRRLFSVLSAVLLLGNVDFQPRKAVYHHDEAVGVCNPEIVSLISELLRVKQETLLAALTAKKAKASGEILIINYRLPEAIAARDAMAKCLYGALFDWIVLQLNHALLSKKDTLREHQGHSIGVLDIFGFEDFGQSNSFEQLCINYANEHLQYYFNQHVFKYEQEEYRKEGIKWNNIDFMDNTACLHLIEGKPHGLLCVLDDQCNFPGATNETLIQKFNSVHKESEFYEVPQRRESAFIVRHYAGKVKYQVYEMREKNLDLMRQDIVGVLKNSSMAFVRELVGADPVAVFRWAIVRAFFRGYFAFHEAGRRHRLGREGNKTSFLQQRFRRHAPNDNLISRRKPTSCSPTTDKDKLSWPGGHHFRKAVVRNTDEDKTTPQTQRTREDSSRLMERANQIVMKNKSFRPRERSKKGLKNLESVKTLAGRTQSLGLVGKSRKQPLTVTAQFQLSLHSLMETLNMANPFFIRCIKSNSQKISNTFDEDTVQRQLRYTGMLETVRIRQAGYNVRLTYDEFIQMYRILLPKGLLSSQNDVRHFLATLNLNRDNYQLGSSKIFLRETEKVKLDYRLHQQIISAIVTIQRWFRAALERRKFLKFREAAVNIQSAWRSFLAQKSLMNKRHSAILIQTAWRRHSVQKWFINFQQTMVEFQASARGFLVRRKWRPTLEQVRKLKREQAVAAAAAAAAAATAASSTTVSVEYNKNVWPTRPVRSGSQEVRVLTIGDPNKSARSSNNNNNNNNTDDVQVKLKSERKGSCDSLSSQKSSDSTGATSVKETFTKAKKQFQAILRGGKKSLEKSDSDGEEYSENVVEVNKNRNSSRIKLENARSEFFNDNENNTLKNDSRSQFYTKNVTLSNSELRSKFFKTDITISCKSKSEDDISPPRIGRREYVKQQSLVEEVLHTGVRDDVWEDEDEKVKTPSHPVLRRGPTTSITNTSSPLDPTAPTRTARKARRTYKIDLHDTHRTSHASEIIKTQEVSRVPCDDRDRTSWSKENVDNTVYMRSTSDTSTRNINVNNNNDHVITTSRHSNVVNKNEFDRNKMKFDAVRRNSDPEPPSDVLEWKGTTMFTIGGHRFRKVSRFSKEDRCVFCDKLDSFLTQGHRCSDCKQLFHTKCIQNGGVLQMPCQRRNRKHSRHGYEIKPQVATKFSLTGTSEFTDSTDKIISDANELQMMQDFITTKIYSMERKGIKPPSDVDRVFKRALKEFKDNLVATYSIANRHGDTLNIKYKDLIVNFVHVMETVCKCEDTKEDFPVTMGVNAFRGFMNEFMTLSRIDPDKPSNKKRKKEKKRSKADDIITFNNHTFFLTIINIPTACEICNGFFMWPLERSLVCQNCKLTCHKKCYNKVVGDCRASHDGSGAPGRHVFGVPLHKLASDGKVPVVVDRLITTIEMYGLYTEGLYRKPGVNTKVKELKVKMEESQDDVVNYENYHVHVLASVLKSFLREMPEPLLTYDCYEDFLRAANLTDVQDRIYTLFQILKKLPKPNFDLMERLIFHLARVALHEEANRMNPSALAIVFAPCILRTNELIPAQDSLHDISKQTQCVETIISEHMRKVKATLADIDTLDTACHTATHRLSSLRSSKIFSPEELLPSHSGTVSSSEPTAEDEEALLVGHIQEIQKEKALLTSTLPSLTRTTSDDDLLSTDMDDGSIDDVDNETGIRSNQEDPIMV